MLNEKQKEKAMTIGTVVLMLEKRYSLWDIAKEIGWEAWETENLVNAIIRAVRSYKGIKHILKIGKVGKNVLEMDTDICIGK